MALVVVGALAFDRSVGRVAEEEVHDTVGAALVDTTFHLMPATSRATEVRQSYGRSTPDVTAKAQHTTPSAALTGPDWLHTET